MIDQINGTILGFYGFGERYSYEVFTFVIVWPQSLSVHVSFITSDVDSSTVPLYTGRAVLLSLAGDLGNIDTPAWLDNFLWSPSGPSRTNIMNKPWWTFDLPNQDFPIFYVTVRYTATELRFDVYESGYTEDQWNTYPPVVRQNGYVGTGTTSYNLITSNYYNPNVDDSTDVSTFPVSDITRNGGGGSSYHTLIMNIGGLELSEMALTSRMATTTSVLLR